MAQRVHDHPEIMPLRMQLAEHPFGTLKRGWQHGYFLCRGLKKVGAEMSLSVMAYNLKRATLAPTAWAQCGVNILGIPKLIAALRERVNTASHSFLSSLDRALNLAARLTVEFSHNLTTG